MFLNITESQLAQIIDQGKIKYNTNTVTIMALLALKKAYDTLWRNSNIHKLYILNIPLPLMTIMNHYSNNGNFGIKIKDVLLRI